MWRAMLPPPATAPRNMIAVVAIDEVGSWKQIQFVSPETTRTP